MAYYLALVAEWVLILQRRHLLLDTAIDMNGKQSGDPGKLAKALLKISDQAEPPARWFAGADAVAEGERKAIELKSQVDPYRELSSSLAIGEVAINA